MVVVYTRLSKEGCPFYSKVSFLKVTITHGRKMSFDSKWYKKDKFSNSDKGQKRTVELEHNLVVL